MTDPEIEALIERAIVRAFRDLGFDSNDPFEVRRDLNFLREWRLTCEQVKAKGTFTLATLTLTGVIALLLLGFRDWIFH